MSEQKKILLTGSTGYIGRRLLPNLLQMGFHVICPVRDKRRFDFDDFEEKDVHNIEVLEVDFSKSATLDLLPKDIDLAYYLIHSLSSESKDFDDMEKETATNFSDYIKGTNARHVVYLGGIANDDGLSKHLTSRVQVEEVLKTSGKPLTVLRAAIIIGSGGASFEIIRDLVEKLPVMVAPKWVHTRCQPIGIANVLDYLIGVMFKERAYDRTFDIGGPDILNYKDMMLVFAKVRNLKRFILTVPVLTPRLSSLWLYFVTNTSFALARNLVDSMKNEVICAKSDIDEIAEIREKHSYEETLKRTFDKIRQNAIVSSWTDAFIDPGFSKVFNQQVKVPDHGVFIDKRSYSFNEGLEDVLTNVFSIGGERGWYYANMLWSIRGVLDKLVGGVGLRRGRRSPTELKNGDALDFWRVLYANREEKRLLLYAEMKLPGEAWLEFRIVPKDKGYQLIQNATFRPLGLLGRLYWYSVLPFHAFIFKNMAINIINYRQQSVAA
jgi:uncharacterized protein YbjT (DUF2867 family)